VCVDYRSWTKVVRLTAMAQELFSRHGQFLLSLENKGSAMSGCWGTVTNPVPDLLIPQAARLRELSLELPALWFIPFLQLPSGSVDALESISFHFLPDRQGRDPFSERVMPVFEGAKMLHKVALHSDYVCMHPALLRLPWSQLTDLKFIGVELSFERAYGLLRQCTSLVNCELTLANESGSAPDLAPAIVPNLRSFTLNVTFDSRHDPLLRSLVLPSLADFHLPYTSQTWRPDTFASLMTRSSCTLQKVAISLVIPSEEIEALLQMLPSLVELSLHAGKPLLPGTVSKISQGELVPRLEILNVQCVGSDYDLVVAMLESRWFGMDAAYPGIRSANIYFGHLPGAGKPFDMLKARNDRRAIIVTSGWSKT